MQLSHTLCTLWDALPAGSSSICSIGYWSRKAAFAPAFCLSATTLVGCNSSLNSTAKAAWQGRHTGQALLCTGFVAGARTCRERTRLAGSVELACLSSSGRGACVGSGPRTYGKSTDGANAAAAATAAAVPATDRCAS